MTHPITPPPELFHQLIGGAFGMMDRSDFSDPEKLSEALRILATRAAQWGADQELEACCAYLVRCAQWEPEDVDEFRAARRPNTPSWMNQ